MLIFSKSIYSILRSVASSTPFSPNFPNCCFPRETALLYANHLRSHFSSLLVSASTGLGSEGLHSFFCCLLASTEFFAAVVNLLSFTASSTDKVVYAMENICHDLALIFSTPLIFPGLCIAFLRLEVFIYYSQPQDEKTSRLISFFSAISLTSWVSKLFECIILSRLLLFLEFNFIFYPCQAVSALVDLLWVKFFIFLIHVRMGLTNPSWVLGQSSLPSTSLKLLTLSGIPLISINVFRLASLLSLFDGLDQFFSTGALAWFLKSQKSPL